MLAQPPSPERRHANKPSADIHFRRSGESVQRARQLTYCINLSLAIGVLLWGIKIYAYLLTESVAILSDAAESVVHFLIVCFAAYSVRLSLKPADRNHLYGHERINFFSVGFEGAMIVVTAIFIFYEAGGRWLSGDLEIMQIESGIGYIALAAAINTALGIFLRQQGKQWQSPVLDANGRHVLTDGITSLGVIIGLILSHITGWLPMDAITAMLIALHILYSGMGLIRRSIGGLMDIADPETDKQLRALLDEEMLKYQTHYHFLRHRDAGGKLIIDFHLLFENDTTISRAHDISMMIEQEINRQFKIPTEITTHFEPLHGHDEAHQIKNMDKNP